MSRYKQNELLYNVEVGVLCYKTLNELYASGQIGTTCAICEETFALHSPRDERKVCDECRHRLKKLLYSD